jgi:hypothetical protein
MSAGDVRPACSVGVEVRGHLVASNAGEVRLQRRPHVVAMKNARWRPIACS